MSENNGSSNNDFKPAPWEKETNSMDDKKNVSFVSGLALLLSVLALVMIGWGNIADSPFEEEYKEAVTSEFSKLKDSIHSINGGLKAREKMCKSKQLNMGLNKLAIVNLKLDSMKMGCDTTYNKELTAIQASVQALIGKMKTAQAGKVVPCAKAAKAAKGAKVTKPCKGHKAEKAAPKAEKAAPSTVKR